MNGLVQVQDFFDRLNTQPQSIMFAETMAVIDEAYSYTPTAFSNGKGDNCVENLAGSNEGSCKLLAFAMDNQLTQEQALHCFGDYYREDVLKNPHGNDHANIRNFIQYGWDGVRFEGVALVAKSDQD